MGRENLELLHRLKKLTKINDDEYLQKQLDEMSNNGLIEYNWENPQHFEKQYVLPMYVPGSAEFTNMNADVLRDHPEMGRFFERILLGVVFRLKRLHQWFHLAEQESECTLFL